METTITIGPLSTWLIAGAVVVQFAPNYWLLSKNQMSAFGVAWARHHFGHAVNWVTGAVTSATGFHY